MKRGVAGPVRSGELRHGILGVVQAFGQSVAVLNLAVAGTVVAAAAVYAGDATPLAFVVGGAGCLCLASVIVRFTTRMVSAGGVYTYIAHGLEPNAGFVGGWLYGSAFAVAAAVVLAIGSASMSTLFANHTGWHPSWFTCFLILLVTLSAFAFFDIRLSTGTQVVLGAACLVTILVLAIVVLGKSGDSGVTLRPLDPRRLPSTHGLFLGVVFAFAAYLGFEAAAALGEEAARPRATIPRAILTAAVFVVAWYVFMSWVIVVGFGTGRSADWQRDITPFDTLAARYAGTWLAVLVDAAVVASAFIAALASTQLTARTFFAMGREGGLPRVFAWTHPRFRSPWVGIAVTLAIALLLNAVLGRNWSEPAPSPFPFVQTMALALTIAVLVVYILVAVSGMAFFWRTRRESISYSIVLDVALPVAAISVCGYTLYESVHPVPPPPVGYGLWIALGWLALGLVVVAWLNLTKPERVRAFGSILGEGETESP